MSKGNPKITIRLKPEEIEHLRDVARLCGSEDTSAFVREMFGAMLSPDVGVRMNYVHGLAVKLGEQLELPLAKVEEPKPRKPRKKRRARDRTT